MRPFLLLSATVLAVAATTGSASAGDGPSGNADAIASSANGLATGAAEINSTSTSSTQVNEAGSGPEALDSRRVGLFKRAQNGFTLTAVVGPNEGVPPVGSILAIGGRLYFEVKNPGPFNPNHVFATFATTNVRGVPVGRIRVDMKNSAFGGVSASVQFFDLDGVEKRDCFEMEAHVGNDFSVNTTSHSEACGV